MNSEMNRFLIIIYMTVIKFASTICLYQYDDRFNSNMDSNLHLALSDIAKGFPTNELTIVFDNTTDMKLILLMIDTFHKNYIAVSLFNTSTISLQENYFLYAQDNFQNFKTGYTLYIGTRILMEHILVELNERHLIRRSLIYIFYWGNRQVERFFLRSMNEMMRIVVITNPRKDVFRIYYNQAVSHKKHHLRLVNWWMLGPNLFQYPTIPSPFTIYKNFNGKTIYVPVIHKPPWHFVQYNNDSIQVLGGRDDKLLCLIANCLNFKFIYFDPPDRSQGSSLLSNGSFEGVLGLIWQREVEFFIGDVAMTIDRAQVVEFSFVTLADSGAFITHSPRKLNEAVALIRPFQSDVWPLIILIIVVSGPILFALIIIPHKWRPEFMIKSKVNLFFNCIWFTTGIFLKQSGSILVYKSQKVRFFIIMLALSATYIIGDMYSANLTSLLARPGRERVINNLQQLEEAITEREYQLVVEKYSSSHSALENGTGVYGRLWKYMNKNQGIMFVKSVEEGVKMIKSSRNLALLAGRETLYFDIQRFGPKYYHLSEKLNTAYSAIAFQIGCPYIDNFNKILMSVFEAGILTKMTNDEYENLGKQESISSDIQKDLEEIDFKQNRLDDDHEKLQPINIKMLQGAFYVLAMGYILSGITFVFEVGFKRKQKFFKKKWKFIWYTCVWRKIKIFRGNIKFYVWRRIRQLFNEAIIKTFDYTE